MNGGTDFLMLYKELRLRPGCALHEFRHAYRRRVAELHPDRVQHHLYEDAAARLSNLNAMYAAAMEFHKQYGRLPGEVTSYRRETKPVQPPAPAAPAQAPADRTQASRRMSWIVTGLLIVAALIAGWLLGAVEHEESDQSSNPDPAPVALATASMVPVARVPRIRVGMDSDQVVEIEGEPVMTGEDRWEYGPSWITFHCGAVLDWYSSPLRPLKVEGQHAPADEVEREAQLRIPGCVKSQPASG